MTVLPDNIRRQLRTGLSANGQVPPELVDLIADLAVHAAESGFEALRRIALETHPDPRVGLCALGPALSLLTGITQTSIEALRKATGVAGMGCFPITLGSDQ